MNFKKQFIKKLFNKKLKIGIIGLGRMARAIISPLLERGEYIPEKVFGVVGNDSSIPEALNELPEGVIVISSNDDLVRMAWEAPIQVLAVKPQQLKKVRESASRFESINQVSKPLIISTLPAVSYVGTVLKS